jgi:hypothetical protein
VPSYPLAGSAAVRAASGRPVFNGVVGPPNLAHGDLDAVSPRHTCRSQAIRTAAPAPLPTERSYNLFLKQATSDTKGDVDLVVIGDSLAEGWEDRFLSATRVINLGVGGNKIQNVL